MSVNEHETHAAVVADIHKIAERFHEDYLSDPVAFKGYERIATEVSTLASRFEAAHKREVDALTAKLKTVGNSAKLREALEAIDKNTDLLDIAEDIAPKLHPSHSFVAVQIRKIVRAALAEPPRNCDIPAKDMDEWCDRFYDYVRRNNPACTKISPLYTYYDAMRWMLDVANAKGATDGSK